MPVQIQMQGCLHNGKWARLEVRFSVALPWIEVLLDSFLQDRIEDIWRRLVDLTEILAPQNIGKYCWKKCDNKSGPCPWCGAGGLCCRKGWQWAGNGCDGLIGGRNRHMCVLKPKEPSEWYDMQFCQGHNSSWYWSPKVNACANPNAR